MFLINDKTQRKEEVKNKEKGKAIKNKCSSASSSRVEESLTISVDRVRMISVTAKPNRAEPDENLYI